MDQVRRATKEMSMHLEQDSGGVISLVRWKRPAKEMACR